VAPDLLAHDDRGTGSPVVLIHGLTFSRQSWDPIAARLADHHRVIALDLPGHGGSSGSGADVVALAERMATTLQSLEVARPVIVGHSAGALHATGLATVLPARGVINVDQPLLIGPFTDFVQRMAPALRGPDFRAAFAPFEQSIAVDALPEPERSRLASTRTIEQEVVLDHWSMPMSRSPQDAQAAVDDMLDTIDVPYLYLAGEEPPEPVRRHLEGHLRHLEVVVWPGSGHLPQHMDIDSFVRLVSDFAARCAEN